MKKFLIVAHYSRFLVQFELRNVAILQEKGYEVHYACNYEQEDMYEVAPQIIAEQGVVLHQIDFVRSPFNVFRNINVYKQLLQLMKDKHFEGVHCHTPMAGVIARLAAKATKTRPVLYTAHGFHFYKGCPLHNRLIYEPVERFMARYTDALITINQEDYAVAKTFKLRGKAYHIPGIGIDSKEIQASVIDRRQKRAEMNIPQDAFVFISVGELSKNKNHITALRAFAKANISNSFYLLCGEGSLRKRFNKEINKFQLQDKVKMLGFQTQISELLKMADVFVFPSIREGLGIAALEAMAAGLPVIASKNRGSFEYAQKEWDGLLCSATSVKEFANAMCSYAKKKCSLASQNQIIAQQFDWHIVNKQMSKIYKNQLDLHC